MQLSQKKSGVGAAWWLGWSAGLLFGALMVGPASTPAAAKGGAAPAVVERPTYTVALDLTALTVGGAGSTTVQITPKPAWELKKETPFRAQLTSSAGLALQRTTFAGKDLVVPKGEAVAKAVRTSCTAKAAGAQSIAAEVTFILCSEQICERHQEKLTLPVQVQP